MWLELRAASLAAGPRAAGGTVLYPLFYCEVRSNLGSFAPMWITRVLF